MATILIILGYPPTHRWNPKSTKIFLGRLYRVIALLFIFWVLGSWVNPTKPASSPCLPSYPLWAPACGWICSTSNPDPLARAAGRGFTRPQTGCYRPGRPGSSARGKRKRTSHGGGVLVVFPCHSSFLFAYEILACSLKVRFNFLSFVIERTVVLDSFRTHSRGFTLLIIY